jgi:hypothetical protein
MIILMRLRASLKFGIFINIYYFCRKLNQMKHFFGLITIFLLVSNPLFSKQPREAKHFFEAHFGYANMLEGTAGLTNSSDKYERDLCSGVSWDAQYSIRLPEIGGNFYFGLGVLYSGYTSQGSLTDSSDHLYTHYFAPMAQFYYLITPQTHIRVDFGFGAISYLNNSMVYGKERRVTGNNIGGHFGLNATQYLFSNFGLSAEISYINSYLETIYSHYHEERIMVKFHDNLYLSRLNISAGITYFF